MRCDIAEATFTETTFIMTEPIVLLNRDRRLDQLSLQCKESVQKRLHIGLARDAKVDGLALDYYNSFTGSRLAPSGKKGSRRRSRKRRALAHAVSQIGYEKAAVCGRKACTSASASDQGMNEGAAELDTRSIQSLTNASSQGGSEQTPKSGTSLLMSNDGCNQGGSEQLSAGTKKPSNDASGQYGIVQATALDRRSGESVADSPDRDGSELAALSNGPSCSSNSQRKEITKEDFMALLCLSPTHVTARVRACNRHRTSKYLYIKSRNLWRQICGEVNDRCSGRDTNTVQRPSYVLLERSNFIDRLALQPVPQSIYLKNSKYNTRTAHHRKWLIGLCRRKPKSLNVVLKRDSGLDRLAVQTPNIVCTSSSNSAETVIVHSAANLISTAPLSTGTTVSHASEEPRCKWPSVQIRRDSGLDMLALQTPNSACEPPSLNSAGVSVVSSCESKLTSMVPVSTHTAISHVLEKPGLKNLSITINRDPCIDQLAVQKSRAIVTDSGSDCNNTTVPYRQLTSKLPLDSAASISSLTKLPGGGMENVMNHNCQSALGIIPNLAVHNFTLTDPRRSVIRLRKISSVDWSIIQPDGQGLGTEAYVQLNRDAYDGLVNPQSSDSVGFGSKSGTTESTGSKSVCRVGGLSTSNSGRSEPSGVYHKTRSRDTHSSAAQQRLPAPLRLSSRQSTFKADPAVGSSVTKSSEEVPKTVSTVSCSESRRKKSVPSTEESPLELHHNENRNPQSHVIAPMKTVVLGGNHSSDAIVKSRVLRKRIKTVLENDPQKELQVARFRDHQNNNDYNLENPSIPCCMHFKKPLGVRSEFYATFNTNQTASSSTQAKK